MSFLTIDEGFRPASAIHEVPALSHDATRRVPRRRLVTQVMTLVSDNLNEPLTVGELSRKAGVSERTLRAAFREVVGLSPKQFALRERLQAARDALSTADPETTTVTDVAMAFGFFELGRFAGRYRTVFGEVPSQTLHRVTASWPQQVA